MQLTSHLPRSLWTIRPNYKSFHAGMRDLDNYRLPLLQKPKDVKFIRKLCVSWEVCVYSKCFFWWNYEGFVGSFSLLAPNARVYGFSRKHLDTKHNCIIRFKCLNTFLGRCFYRRKRCLNVSLFHTEVCRMDWICMLQTADLLCCLLLCRRE